MVLLSVGGIPRSIVGTVAHNGFYADKARGHARTHLRLHRSVSADDGLLQRQKRALPDVLEVVLLHILSDPSVDTLSVEDLCVDMIK